MKRRKLRALWAVLIMAIAILLISSQTVLVSAKNGAAPARGGQKSERGQRSDHAQRSDEGQMVVQGQKGEQDRQSEFHHSLIKTKRKS